MLKEIYTIIGTIYNNDINEYLERAPTYIDKNRSIRILIDFVYEYQYQLRVELEG